MAPSEDIPEGRPIDVIITGGGGFVGQWLARRLLHRGDSVCLAGRGTMPARGVLDESERRAVEWFSVDLRDPDRIKALVRGRTVDRVFHLAGVSFIPDAEETPTDAYEINTLGAVRLASTLARARDAGQCDPSLLVVGSATQYGPHEAKDLPLDEMAEQRPTSVYGATKAAQEIAVLQIARASGLRVVCTRSFNHSGPGQDQALVVPGMVAQALAARASGRAITMGNDTVRDYLHVEDVVDAYVVLAEKGMPGAVYNVCSGIGTSVRQLTETILHRVGVSVPIHESPTRRRSVDLPLLVGSPRRLSATGWTPRRSLTDIIDDIIAWQQR